MDPCPLCRPENETVLWRDARCRVILIDDPDYSGFCRVIWQEHVKEMTDLVVSDRAHLMVVVLAVEEVLRKLMHPDKMNLAALGNQIPHLHWHVIPRFVDDTHYPDPVWATRKRHARKAGQNRAVLIEQLTLAMREHPDLRSGT